VVEGQRFTCAEQYMMVAKALLFGDHETAERILVSDDPQAQQTLGRAVRGFDERV
jgi:predicted NAD-dependent protein-ADP-ribosyltransferase YbiA (DUF1768 family)